MGYTLPSAWMPSGNVAAMISPTSLPNAAPVSHTEHSRRLNLTGQTTAGNSQKHGGTSSPIRNTGMKAPQGTGMVVATADIQNWEGENRVLVEQREAVFKVLLKFLFQAHLHDDEENERDEDVDLRVFPGVMVADVVELLSYALTAPRTVVKQSDQRLVLRQLTGRQHKQFVQAITDMNKTSCWH